MIEPNRWLPIFLFFIVSVSFGVAAPALAQTQGEQDAQDGKARAAEFYLEASEAYTAGDFARAAELLERAFAHDGNLVYKYNEILANQGMGAYEEALRLLDIYGDPMRGDGRFDDIDELQEELEAADKAWRAEQEAREAAEREAEQEEDGEAQEVVEPPAPAESPNILAWSLIGGGSAALATGVILSTGVLIGDTMDRLDGSRTSRGYESIYRDGTFDRDEDVARLKQHRIMSAAFLAGGLIIGGVGGTLLLLDGRSRDDSGGDSLGLSPMLGEDVAGAFVTGRF